MTHVPVEAARNINTAVEKNKTDFTLHPGFSGVFSDAESRIKRKYVVSFLFLEISRGQKIPGSGTATIFKTSKISHFFAGIHTKVNGFELVIIF